jgi:aminopeptidase N
MRTDLPKTVYLKDYTPLPYKVKHIDLRFEIFDGRTVVHATTQFTRNGSHKEPLFLYGEDLKLLSAKLDGREISADIDDKGMTLPPPDADEFTMEFVTEIYPEKNTRLEGLYNSGGTYCTQCEAEGFRRITFYPDRPDVMATFRVRIEADKEKCPVLLSNGNLVESGDIHPPPLPSPLEKGEGERLRHFTVWDDPTPKSCYLFALVAGDLTNIHDTFTTMSGNKVDLYIYVRKGDEGQCGHAMTSLKKSMKWDEDVYGREYQYNIFNIVAVSDFNMGAMENTSLNIFNTALVLAHPETATDNDFLRVESVIAHEYFHNWTGNRVTCRDWFQLTLKEGLTVFRDQEFSADLNSRAVQRIDDVQHLRKMQFPEDAGPLAHPIQPDNYIEINNFYTMTVYEKGAEVIRMFHTLLGADTYRKATDLYFDRFDGQAVTCQDWVKCMEDASGLDLTQFRLWYSQAGTPEVEARGEYDAAAKTYTLTFKQHIPATPGQSEKKPMHVPVAVGLVGANGEDMELPPLPPRSRGGSTPPPACGGNEGGAVTTIILHLTQAEQRFTFENIGAKPVPSILRNFSAPVKLTTDLTDDDLRFLMVHDSDGFNRWEAGQNYALRCINRMIDGGALEQGLIDALESILDLAIEGKEDKALLARALSLPEVGIIAQTRDVVDPDRIYNTREKYKAVLRDVCGGKLISVYQTNMESGAFSISPEAMAKRSLKNVCLSYLDDPALALQHYQGAGNMTDRVAALSALTDHEGEKKESAFSEFYQKFENYPLVVDKWFSLQAMSVNDNTIGNIKSLAKHKDFTLKNPNRVRSLYSAFAMNNPVAFHRADGSGYNLLRDAVISLNDINPQIAARLLTPLREWRRYTQDRQAKMQKTLQEIAIIEKLSPDVFEIVSKSLKG